MRRFAPLARLLVWPVLGTACVAAVPGMGTAQRASDLYPEWFIRAPAAGARVAVGYAPVYGDSSTSVEEALGSAALALQVAAGVRVHAEYLQETLHQGQVAFRGERYEEQPMSRSAPRPVAVDTSWGPRMVLLLATTGGASVPGPAVMRAFPRRAPDWVSRTPDSPDGTYAVGAAEAHFNEHEAWMEAERQARRNLAFGRLTELRSGTTSHETGAAQGALIASTNAVLSNVEVRERWRDSRRLFVLVHAQVAASSP